MVEARGARTLGVGVQRVFLGEGDYSVSLIRVVVHDAYAIFE